MGRVYKALVRAESFAAADRPIGRPERKRAIADGGDDVASGLLQDSSNTTLAYELEDDFAKALGASSYTESAPLLERRDIPANASVQLQRSVVPSRRSVVGTAASGAPVIEFEEPSHVSNVRDLTVDPHVAVLTGGDSIATERYRALAVKLLNLASLRKMKTLLFTSAQPGDGKSTIALGAAWALAKGAERRVLFIDAGLTSSSAARMLGVTPKRGWLNLLNGSTELKHALVKLEPKGLYLLTAGMSDQQAGDAASGLEDLIAELSPRFDLIIVDSGSILESTEAQRLASILDGSVIVVRANHTHHSKVGAARKLVPKERRLGVVLNDSGISAGISHRTGGKNGLVGRLFGRRR